MAESFDHTPEHDLLDRWLKPGAKPEPSEYDINLREDQSQLATPFLSIDGETTSPHRLNVFEAKVAGILKPYFEVAKKNGNGKATDAGVMNRLFSDYEGLFPQHLSTLKPEEKNDLETEIRGLLESGLSEGNMHERAVRALSIKICLILERTFERSIRRQVRELAPNDLFDANAARAILKSPTGVLRARSVLRSISFLVGTMTSFWGIGEWISIFADYLKVDSPTLVALLRNSSIIPAWIMSSTILDFKRLVEITGARDNVSFRQAYLTVFKERKALALLVTLALMPADLTTNVEGLVKRVFGESDTLGQIDEGTQQVKDCMDLYRQAIDQTPLTDSYKDACGIKEDDSVAASAEAIPDSALSVKDRATVDALEALIDEVSGTYSGQEGIGPRFYGLAAAYFRDSTLLSVSSNDFSGTAGSQCVSSIGEELTYEPPETVGGKTKKWTIAHPADGVWCVYSKDSEQGANHPGSAQWAFIIGKGTQTPEAILSELSQQNIGYGAAWRDYQYHIVQGEDEGDKADKSAYPTRLDRVWTDAIHDIHAEEETQFALIDEVLGEWKDEGGDIPIVQYNADAGEVNGAFGRIKERRDTIFPGVQRDVAAIGAQYRNFNEALITDVCEAERNKDGAQNDATCVHTPIPAPQMNLPEIPVVEVDFDHPGENRNWVEKLINDIERKPMDTPLAIFVVLIGASVGLVDWLFYKRVVRAYQQDRATILKNTASLKEHLRELFETLRIHLQVGPYAALYSPVDKVATIPDDVILDRLKNALLVFADQNRIATHERGLVLGMFDAFVRKMRDEEGLPLKKEFGLGVGRYIQEDTPVMYAYRRLLKAVERFTNDPDALHGLVMQLSYEGGNFRPEDLVENLRGESPNGTGDAFSAKYHNLAADAVRTRPSEETAHQLYPDRAKGLQKKLERVIGVADLNNPTWIMDFMEISCEVEALLAEEATTPGDRIASDALRDIFYGFIQSQVAKEQSEKSVQTGTVNGLKAQLGQEVNVVEEKFIEPLLNNLAARLIECQPPELNGVVNEITYKREIDRRLEVLRGILSEVPTLQISSKKLSAVRERIKADIKTYKDELQKAKSQVEEAPIQDQLRRQRLKTLLSWFKSQGVLPEQGDLQFETEEAARAFLLRFRTFFGSFYDGVVGEDTLASGSSQELDLTAFVEAGKLFGGALREHPEKFGFTDLGFIQRYDPAYALARGLNAAFQKLGEENNIGIKPMKVAPQIASIYRTTNS
jgi:hypothetical protein